jgi:hypothetical protein
MKKTILTIVSFLLSVVVVSIGSIMMNIYIQHKFSLFTFALGSIGFMILYGSIENWEVKFNKWFKLKKDE